MTRLIDADALKEYIDCGHLRPPTEICFSELDVCTMIDNAPTIEPSGDLISRADAKQQISEWATIITKPTLLDKDATMVVLDSLPSAEAVQGEWIHNTNAESVCEEWKCSKCGYWNFVETDYCPNCGAKMNKGGEDE